MSPVKQLCKSTELNRCIATHLFIYNLPLKHTQYKCSTTCLRKKRANLFCCFMLDRYKLISVKIGTHVLEETLNKIVQKVLTSLTIIVLACGIMTD